MTRHRRPIGGIVPAPWQTADLPRETPVLLALSGGADSRLLLHILAEQSKRDGFPLLLAHVEHGIRGETSLRDRAFCEALAQRYRLPIEVLAVSVPALAEESGRGWEEEAREVRYAFFGRVMKEKNIPILVTAHQADDNLETVLFRLCRGTGTRGLCGIPPVRKFGEAGVIVRPLLKLTKREVLSLCAEEGLEYVSDESNSDLSYARNRIRREIVPVMEELFPEPQKRVGQMTGSLREDLDLAEECAKEFLRREETPDGISAAALQNAHPALRHRALEEWILREGGDAPEASHYAALDVLLKKGTGGECSLPGGVKAVLHGGTLRILPDDRTPAVDYRIPFEVGEFSVAGTDRRVRVRRTEPEEQAPPTGIAVLVRIPEGTEKECFWRPRKDGDRMRLRGVNREVRRLYREAGIPARLRDRLPLLCDKEGILWVPSAGLRDGGGKSGIAYQVELTGNTGADEEKRG